MTRERLEFMTSLALDVIDKEKDFKQAFFSISINVSNSFEASIRIGECWYNTASHTDIYLPVCGSYTSAANNITYHNDPDYKLAEEHLVKLLTVMEDAKHV